MTIKVLSGSYLDGYTIRPPTMTVSITSSGYVSGTGVESPASPVAGYTIINEGRIRSTQAGVYLRHGGWVTNGAAGDFGASIVGTYAGVGILNGVGTVTNYGSITSPSGATYKFADVSLADGGDVTNGAASDTHALLSGYAGIAIFAAGGSVSNFGTILGTGTGAVGLGHAQKIAGIYLAAGGGVTNGVDGVIRGAIGISDQTFGASILNYGIIAGINGGGAGDSSGEGVRLFSGGSLINGSVSSSGATITGASYGVLFQGYQHAAAALLRNYGDIVGPTAVRFGTAGEAVNGSVTDTTAVISGETIGVYAWEVSALTLLNYGTVSGSAKFGVEDQGGPVTNGSAADTSALISGMEGLSGAPRIANFGTIVGTGGAGAGFFYSSVTNGAIGDTTALITGLQAIDMQREGTVANFGSIVGKGDGAAIQLNPNYYAGASGHFVNGAANDTTALILGGYGIDGESVRTASATTGTVSNFGTIEGTIGAGIRLASENLFRLPSYITNGSTIDVVATIEGGVGNALGHCDGLASMGGKIVNFGTIASSAIGYGVRLSIYGSLTNGARSDTKALIEGYGGVYFGGGGASTLVNYGTIIGSKGPAVRITSNSATLAIESGSSIRGAVQGDGATLDFGAGVAAISAIVGGAITTTGPSGATTFTNFGTLVCGAGSTVSLIGNGTITSSGSGQHVTALALAGELVVDGGLVVTAATVSGAGTLALAAGTSVLNARALLTVARVLIDGSGKLIVNSNLTYSGDWAQTGGALSLAAGATLDLRSANPTLAGVIGGAGAVTVQSSGALAITSLSIQGNVAFTCTGAIRQTGTLTLADSTVVTNADWTLIGGARIAVSAGDKATVGGQFYVQAGTSTATIAAYLTSYFIDVESGVLALSGGMSLSGVNARIAGAGVLSVTGGVVTFAKYTGSQTFLQIAHVQVSGAATTLIFQVPITYAGAWMQTGGTLEFSGVGLTLTKAAAISGATIVGSGGLTFEASSNVLASVVISAVVYIAPKAAATVSGMIEGAGIATLSGSGLIVGQTGLVIESGGSINLSNGLGDLVTGASATARIFLLSGTIQGAGQLGGGQMTLVNRGGGTIDANGAAALTIDTGAVSISNAGLIESTGHGGLVIQSALVNFGQLKVTAGTLIADGAVTGPGTLMISSGAADFMSAFSENVAFDAEGALELSQSVAFHGAISGFSTSKTTNLDLRDITYTAGMTKASYSGTTVSGVLTVTDGVHMAQIKLNGDYTAASFLIASDKQGGTTVVAWKPADAAGFVAAMASIGGAAASTASLTWGSVPTLSILANPMAHQG